MTAWYNEPDPFAAQWLRNLIAAGHIAPGIVDERPIQEIEAYEIAGYTQCHFFAGIGVWSYALRQARWPDDQPIWTGSCPCQPFSQAGKQKGFADDRHLWPHWKALIEVCRPPRIIGEQVASALDWLDLVQADMEASDYTFGAADLCAAGFGGAYIRQRIYFVGLANSRCDEQGKGCRDFSEMCSFSETQRQSEFGASLSCGNSDLGRLADADRRQRAEIADSGECFSDGKTTGREQGDSGVANDYAIGRLADDDDAGLERWLGVPECRSERIAGPGGMVGRMEHSESDGREQWRTKPGERSIVGGRCESANSTLRDQRQAGSGDDDHDWLLCRNPAGEPSWRPVESGTFPLAHGVASRMGKLRAYGNALDAKTATEFCKTVKDIVGV